MLIRKKEEEEDDDEEKGLILGRVMPEEIQPAVPWSSTIRKDISRT